MAQAARAPARAPRLGAQGQALGEAPRLSCSATPRPIFRLTFHGKARPFCSSFCVSRSGVWPWRFSCTWPPPASRESGYDARPAEMSGLVAAFILFVLVQRADFAPAEQCTLPGACCGRQDSDVWRPPTLLATEPRIFLIDNLFNQSECELLIERARSNGMRSAQIMGANGELKAGVGDTRVSLTTTLGEHGRRGGGTDNMVQAWRDRMSNAALLPEANAEALVVTQYVGGEGNKYELHFDSSLAVGRIATVLVFLTTVHEGGECIFPWALTPGERESGTGSGGSGATGDNRPDGVRGRGRPLQELVGVTREPPILPMCADPDDAALKVSPRAGRALVFFNHDPQLQRYSYRAMHAGCPPTRAGEDKWIAQIFLKWHEPVQPNLLARAMALLNERWQLPTT